MNTMLSVDFGPAYRLSQGAKARLGVCLSRRQPVVAAGLVLILITLLRGSASAAPVGSFLYYAFDPPVIYNDGAGSTTLEVVTTGQGIKEVQVNVQNVWKRMFNDGTRGDKKAGDATWTLDGITMSNTSCTWLAFQKTHSTYGFQVKIVKTSSGAVKDATQRGAFHKFLDWINLF